MPTKPALTIRSVTGAQARSATDAPALSDASGPTLAARLRALPRGSLSSRRDALSDLARRMADLRDRLSGHSGR